MLPKIHFIYSAIVRYLQILVIPVTSKVTLRLKFTNACSCLYLKGILDRKISIFIFQKNQPFVVISPYKKTHKVSAFIVAYLLKIALFGFVFLWDIFTN